MNNAEDMSAGHTGWKQAENLKCALADLSMIYWRLNCECNSSLPKVDESYAAELGFLVSMLPRRRVQSRP